MYYTVGEISKKLNISPHTLRFYSKEGLLPDVERSAGGIRMFKESDIESIFLIQCLKTSGMSIKEIRTFVNWCSQGDSTIDQRLAMFRKQKKKVMAQIAQLHETLNTIEYKCWYYETAQAAGTCAVHNTLKPEDIPENIRKLRKSMDHNHCCEKIK